jgi:hypothetical protein
VHHGLKDQKLPGEDFRYGVRGVKGSSTEMAMKAGQRFGVNAYKNTVAEQIYESTRREPLGRPVIRGHNIKMLPEGFGNPSGEYTDGKFVIFPVSMKPDPEEVRALYRKSHNNMLPGERINREYNMPKETTGENFRFGKANMQQSSQQPCFKTTLKSPAFAGDTRLDVVNSSGFKVGDKILINGQEGNAVVGFGSLILENGLLKDVVAGATVEQASEGMVPSMGAEGVGARFALNMAMEEDGNFKQTRFVQRVAEDYRAVQHTKVMRKVHCKQGPSGPPLPPGHRYGIKSTSSDFTARSCIKGYYKLDEQLPDQDLGCCQKPGRRNVTTETRAFGVPSVRTDVPAPPPGLKSVADLGNYGDECGAAALLGPQRFDNKGVPDSEFLVRRTREELESLVNNCHYDMGEDFDELFEECVGMFDDGLPLVSLDAMLFVHQQQIDNQVARRLAPSASAPNLRAH